MNTESSTTYNRGWRLHMYKPVMNHLILILLTWELAMVSADQCYESLPRRPLLQDCKELIESLKTTTGSSITSRWSRNPSNPSVNKLPHSWDKHTCVIQIDTAPYMEVSTTPYKIAAQAGKVAEECLWAGRKTVAYGGETTFGFRWKMSVKVFARGVAPPVTLEYSSNSSHSTNATVVSLLIS